MRENSFPVIENFLRSVKQLAKRLEAAPLSQQADVRQEDARHLTSVESASIDVVLTSPPYLNAIDYLRGHRFALVWLGYRLSELRSLRADSIGIERVPEIHCPVHIADEIISSMAEEKIFSLRELPIIRRFVFDLAALLAEISRVLRPGGKAIFVVGNSCIRGIFVKNTQAIKFLAQRHGLLYQEEEERVLPPNRRYLPPPGVAGHSDLNKRMRTETILKFVRS